MEWYSVFLQRPLCCLSVLISWSTFIVIIVRLMPNKDARKTYQVVIMLQSVFDMLDSTSRPICVIECSNYYIAMVPRFLRVLSWLLTAVTAIFWLRIFIGRSYLTGILFAALSLISAPIILVFIYILIARTSIESITLNENMAIAWIKASSLLLCAIIVIFCLIRVLITDISTFATATTYKGYKKVAGGLFLKTLSIVAVAVSTAHDAIRQTTTAEPVPSWQYFFIDIYPGVNSVITIWMIRRLLYRPRDSTPVAVIPSDVTYVK